MLSDDQQQALDFCLSTATAPEGFRSLLFHGASGAGKRTIARALAQLAGLDFVEVPVSGALSDGIRTRLVGSEREAERSLRSGTPPGELGRSTTTLLYFSGIQDLPSDYWHEFHRLLTRRRYVDAQGTEWRLSADTWLVGGLTAGIPGANIGFSHWICTGFERRCQVYAAQGPESLLTISRGIVEDIAPRSIVAASAGDVFRRFPLPYDNLHALRRWIEALVRNGKEIDEVGLEWAISEDLGYILSGVVYRGQTIGIAEARSWLNQIQEEIRPIAAHLLRELATRFYISPGQMYAAAQTVIDASGIRPGSEVVFCRWQPLGRSPDRVAHMLKNQANWRVTREIDLRADAGTWPRNVKDGWFVIADDFVGTGNTLNGLVNDKTASLRRLVAHYPLCRVRVLIIAGFDKGIQSIIDSFQTGRQDIKVLVGRMFADEDRCFHPLSAILHAVEHRDLLAEYCRQLGRTKLRLSEGMHLGYEEFGGLVVFPDTVPNNTLPMLWRSRAPEWKALFPASGL